MKKSKNTAQDSPWFILDDAEPSLLKNKQDKTQLAFSVMLKLFQLENTFPAHLQYQSF